jgi:hypothetical protein
MNESSSSSEPPRPEAKDRAQEIAGTARNLPLGDYLTDALVKMMPADLTDGTVRLLGRFLSHCDKEVRADEPATEAFPRALDTSQLGTQLKARWVGEGGELSPLKKLIAMVAYRTDVLRPIPWQMSGQDHDHATTSPTTLERFWSAGGHDLTELAGFLKSVDREGMDWLPQ